MQVRVRAERKGWEPGLGFKVRVRTGVGVGCWGRGSSLGSGLQLGIGVQGPGVPVRGRAKEVQHLVGLAQHDAAAVAEAQGRDAAPRRLPRDALVLEAQLLLAAPRHRLRHAPLRRGAPPPVDAAPPREVVARVEVARRVDRPAGRRVVRLLALGAGAALCQPQVRGPARRECPAHQPHPTHARVAQPLPPKVRPVEHRDALQARMQLRLPLQDQLGAAALPVEDRRLPLDHACRVELGRQACPVFLADRQPGRGALGALGRQHASSLERSYALVRRQRPPLQFLVHGILRRVGGAMHDEQGAEQRRAETRREDTVPCHIQRAAVPNPPCHALAPSAAPTERSAFYRRSRSRVTLQSVRTGLELVFRLLWSRGSSCGSSLPCFISRGEGVARSPRGRHHAA